MIAANLNSANNQLAANMNNFTRLNNELASSNTTLINLKINQTQITNQLNLLKNEGIGKDGNTKRIT